MGDTRAFKHSNETSEKIKCDLALVYDALQAKGYNPINQIVGYIITEDPGYITTFRDARNIIKRMDRFELLKCMICEYLDVDKGEN